MNLIVIDAEVGNDQQYLENLAKETDENSSGFIILRIGGNLKNFHETFKRTFLIPKKAGGLETAEKFLDGNQKIEKLIVCSESADFREKIIAMFPLAK